MDTGENNVSLKKVKKTKKTKQTKSSEKINILSQDIMEDKNIEICVKDPKIVVTNETDTEIVNVIEGEKLALEVLESISNEDEDKQKSVEDKILEEENRRWQEEEDETNRLLELERLEEIAKNKEENKIELIDTDNVTETVVDDVVENIVDNAIPNLDVKEDVLNIDSVSLSNEEEKEINSLVNNLIKNKVNDKQEINKIEELKTNDIKHQRFFTKMSKKTRLLMSAVRK